MENADLVSLIRRYGLLVAVCGLAILSTPPARGAVSIDQVSSTDWQISNSVVTLNYNPTTGSIYNLNVLLNGKSYNEVNSSSTVPNINHGSPTSNIYSLDIEDGGTISSGYTLAGNYIDFYTTIQPSSTVPFTEQDHYVLEAGQSGIQEYSQVTNTPQAAATTFPNGSGFVMKSSDLNLTGYFMANTSFSSQGTFQYNVPPMSAQAAAAAVASRNVQNETIDYTGSANSPALTETYTPSNGQTGTTTSNYITKYDFSTTSEFHIADGLFGTESNGTTLGIWDVYGPGTETQTGGPNRQDEFGESSGPMFVTGYGSNHYGGAQYSVPANTSNSRFFGPFYLYFNATNGTTLTNPTQLYDDAAGQANDFQSFYDNETQMVAAGYVPSTQRGAVTATVANTGGWSSTLTNNVVVLSDNAANFQASNQGDQYWGYVNQATNSVTLPGVVPGTYRLSAYERGQFGELRMNNVVVNANGTTTISGLQFVPESFGQTVFTIGTPDRSANEFEFGHIGNTSLDQRNYQGQYDYYGALANSAVPGAVDYYATQVGSNAPTNSLANFPMNMWYQFDPNEYAGAYDSSDTTEDGYSYVVAKSAPYVGNPATYVPPPWEIHFTLTPQQLQDKYVVLSLGIAAEESDLTVSLNGHSLLWKGYQRMATVNDPMQRSGVSGYYQWVAFQWDMADLNAAGADDELDLSVNRVNGVMWDAFRMEVSNTGANPATTGWSDYEYLYNSTDTLVNDSVSSDDGNPSEIAPEPAMALWAMGFLGCGVIRRPRKRKSARLCGRRIAGD